MKQQMDLGLPDKLAIKHFDDRMQITRQWFGGRAILLVLFAIVWDVILYTWFSDMGNQESLFASLFPLIHVIAGICITYCAIANCFNKSHISVSNYSIEVSHKPVPWIGDKKIKSQDVKQLFVKEKISTSNNSTTVTYSVHAILNSNQNTKLVSGLTNSEQALYIEQEIEKYLGIVDAKVKGEFG